MSENVQAVLNGDVDMDYDFYNDVPFQDEIEKYADVTTEFDADVDHMLGKMQHAFY